jgi:hypothetical protein
MRAGRIVLTIWLGFQVALAAGIVVAITLCDRHAPAFSILFEPREVGALAPRVLATVDGLAILANALVVALCALALYLIWTRRPARDLGALAAALAFVQAMGFASDRVFDDRDLVANLISSAILGAGVLLSWRGRARSLRDI